MTFHKTTELEAVNAILRGIGEAPVNSLTDPNLTDANVARTVLSQISRQVQLRGWFWNSETRVPLSADDKGSIYLPPNTLRVDPSDDDKNFIVARGNRLYDTKNHTFSFTPTSTVFVDIVYGFDWDDLPQAAREYIQHRAARKFQEDMIGSPELSSFQARQEQVAWLELLNDEAEVADFNILTDDYSVYRVLDR